MKTWMWIANIVGWPSIQLGFAWFTFHQSVERYEKDSWVTRERAWENSGEIYRRVFRVDRWRRLLPNGAAWMRVPQERQLKVSGRSDCFRFVAETRRSEQAHWCMLLCTPLFFVWNPLWACFVMATYGIGANVPCIIAQRSNRLRAQRAMMRERTIHREGSALR